MYLSSLAQGERSDSRRYSSTAAVNIESPVPAPVLASARRSDNINTYKYGVRDGIVRGGVGIVRRSGMENSVRFELGESGNSRVRNGIRDAVFGSDDEFPPLQDHKLSCRVVSHELQDRRLSCQLVAHEQQEARANAYKQ